MRIATFIIGLLLGAILAIQSLLVFGLSSAATDSSSAGAGSLGVGAALMWLIACAIVIPAPRGSIAFFGIAAFLCFAGSTEFRDLQL